MVNQANNHDLSYSLPANHVRPTQYESCKIEITAFDNVISTARFDRKFDKRVVGDITPTFRAMVAELVRASISWCFTYTQGRGFEPGFADFCIKSRKVKLECACVQPRLLVPIKVDILGNFTGHVTNLVYMRRKGSYRYAPAEDPSCMNLIHGCRMTMVQLGNWVIGIYADLKWNHMQLRWK